MRRSILSFIKGHGSAKITELARELGVSYEAIRQQVVQLEGDGLIVARLERSAGGKAGRPTKSYVLSNAGEHAFVKHYDVLASELIATIAAKLGDEALHDLLSELTETRVRRWLPRLEGKSLEERLEILKNIYVEDDPFTSVQSGDAEPGLIERNCPFFNVASRQPRLCSVTISTLSRLLGYRVRREKKFQDGDGCCVFRILTDQPINPETFRFEYESES